ncbi:alpha/beta hydrolase, partial [Vibrio vulnificus]
TDEDSSTEPIRGRSVLIMRGDKDKWTSAPSSQNFAERAQGSASEIFYVRLVGAGHFMFDKIAIWQRLSASFLLRQFGTDLHIPLKPKVTKLAD